MADLMQQAREFLTAAWIEAGWPPEAAAVLASGNDTQLTVQLSAIAAALHAAPEGFVMVPVVPTPEMDAHGRHALSKNGVDSVDESDALVCWSAMLAARPQGVSHG